MIDLVIDPRDPELVPLGPSSDGSKYRPVQVTVSTSRDVRLAAGGFVLGGAKVDEQIPVGGSLTVSVPATDGAEVLEADRSTFEYVVTLTWSRVGKSRDTATRTFRGLLPTSLGSTVQVTSLVNAEPLPAPYTSIQDIVDGVADITDPVTAGLVNTASATRTALDARYPKKGDLVINVTDHGIAGGGDDTTALNALVASLPAGGATLLIPAGKTVLLASGPLLLRSNVSLVGAGKRASWVVVTGNHSATKSTNPASRIDNVTLRGLRVQRTVAGTVPVIDMAGVSHSSLEDLDVQQDVTRGTSVGVRYGVLSYYNRQTGVQVRGVDIGVLMQSEANGNRVLGNNAVLDANYGYVVDGSNSNLFMGAAAEHVDTTGFVLRNGSKGNAIMGCRVEDVPLCYQSAPGSGVAAFDNYIIGNYALERTSPPGVKYDVQGSNVVIDTGTAALFNGNSYLLRTYVQAWRSSTAQAAIPASTWTRVAFNYTNVDHLGEMPTGPTATVQRTGLYTITAGVKLPTTVGARTAQIAVYVNGVLRRIIDERTDPAATTSVLSGTAQEPLSAGDTVELWLHSTASVGVTQGGGSTYLQITRHA